MAQPSAGARVAGGVLFRQPITPPLIATQPASRTAEEGTDVLLSPETSTCSPAVCRWLFNGTQPLTPGNPSPGLSLTRVKASNSGAYTLVASNFFGAATSTPAALNVARPVPRQPAPWLRLTLASNTPLHIEHSRDPASPASWIPRATIRSPSNSASLGDPTLPAAPSRCHRAWQPGPVAPPRLAGPEFVPALTLTGAPGDRLRVDGIPAAGPVDAWSALGRVTLTNTSQLFFDPTPIPAPPRLCRIVPVNP